MHYYDGQIFDHFGSVSDANKFIVSLENDKDFDHDRMHCAIFNSLTDPRMLMVVVRHRVMTLTKREVKLDELLVKKIRARSSHDTDCHVHSSSCQPVS